MEVKLVIKATRDEDLVNVPGKAYQFENAKIITIGRGETNDVPLTDTGRTISRNHVQLERAAHGYVLQDLNSKNFSFVNEGRIDPDEPCLLYNGDRIRLGEFELEYTLVLEATMVDPAQMPPDYSKNNPFIEPVEQVVAAWERLSERYEATSREAKKEYLAYALKSELPALEGNHIVQMFANMISETQLTSSTQLSSGDEALPRDLPGKLR